MPGRPRSRIAGRLVERMVESLYWTGPATMPELLDRIGYGAEEPLTRIERAAVRMAIAVLVRHAPVRLAPDGELHYHRPGYQVEREVADLLDPIVRREREIAPQAPLYVPEEWT